MRVHACSVMSNSATPWFKGSSFHRIFQARILEWVAISSSRGYSRPRDWTHVSCIGRWILYQWVTREARKIQQQLWKVWSNRLKCIDFDSLAVNRHWVKKREIFNLSRQLCIRLWKQVLRYQNTMDNLFWPQVQRSILGSVSLTQQKPHSCYILKAIRTTE